MFIAPDVLALVRVEAAPATVSTWNVRSGQFLETVLLHGRFSYQIMCKITNTEFVLGGDHGHLFSFEHEGGRNLRETKGIWKAHGSIIWTISFLGGTIVTTSVDATARLWAAETKRRLAILYHNYEVLSSAISDEYIVTCSRYSKCTWEKSELRIYRNSEGYPVMKILQTPEGLFTPTLLDGGRVLCIRRGYRDENTQCPVRYTLVVVDFENETMLAQLKVGCRGIVKNQVLSDGRLVAMGYGGCCGVIATLPRELARLICPKAMEDHSKLRRQRMCRLM